MTSQPAQQAIAIHILTKISISKDNHTTALCHLLEYDWVNIFLKKSYAQCGGETIPDRFLKNQN